MESFLTSKGINPPLYCIGQAVQVLSEFEDDDKNTSICLGQGVIVGVVHELAEFYVGGWFYKVRFETRDQLSSCPWLPLPHDEFAPESELRVI